MFPAVVEPILAACEQLRDEERELAGIVELCVQKLGACLQVTRDPAARQALREQAERAGRWPAAAALVQRLVQVLRAHGTKPARMQAAELEARLAVLAARQA